MLIAQQQHTTKSKYRQHKQPSRAPQSLATRFVCAVQSLAGEQQRMIVCGFGVLEVSNKFPWPFSSSFFSAALGGSSAQR